jgi:hypothetical protein
MILLEDRTEIDHRVDVLAIRGAFPHRRILRLGKEVAQRPESGSDKSWQSFNRGEARKTREVCVSRARQRASSHVLRVDKGNQRFAAH